MKLFSISYLTALFIAVMLYKENEIALLIIGGITGLLLIGWSIYWTVKR